MVENPPASAGDVSGGFHPWVRRIAWRRGMAAHSRFLPGKSHGQRSLVGYRPWGHKELDMTEQSLCQKPNPDEV